MSQNKILSDIAKSGGAGLASSEMRAGSERLGNSAAAVFCEDDLKAGERDGDFYTDLFGGNEGIDFGARRRGPGRPKGSKNRTTAEMRRLVLANYRDPLMNCMDVVAMKPKQICKEWSIKPKEAAQLWFQCLNKALEYLHQKQPTSVLVAGIQFHDVNINLGTAPTPDSLSAFDAGINQVMNSVGYEAGDVAVAQSGEVVDA